MWCIVSSRTCSSGARVKHAHAQQRAVLQVEGPLASADSRRVELRLVPGPRPSTVSKSSASRSCTLLHGARRGHGERGAQGGVPRHERLEGAPQRRHVQRAERTRTATGMLYAALSGASWCRNHRRLLPDRQRRVARSRRGRRRPVLARRGARRGAGASGWKLAPARPGGGPCMTAVSGSVHAEAGLDLALELDRRSESRPKVSSAAGGRAGRRAGAARGRPAPAGAASTGPGAPRAPARRPVPSG